MSDKLEKHERPEDFPRSPKIFQLDWSNGASLLGQVRRRAGHAQLGPDVGWSGALTVTAQIRAQAMNPGPDDVGMSD